MPVRLQKHERTVLKETEKLVRSLGGVCDVLPGRHNKLQIRIGDKTRSTPLSSSPRQADDFIRRKMTDVRRILHQLEVA